MTEAVFRLEDRADLPSSVIKHDRGRLFDVVTATILLLIMAPIMALVALAVYVEDGGPVLFAQTRVGRGGKYLPCFKFRSMCVDAESRLASLLARDPEAAREWQATQKLKIDPRVTRVGAVIRKTSLDELPQLVNIIRGEMSLVGPRPIVPSEVVRYGRRIRHYQAVRPGLTGLWQISGRNDVSYRSRVAMDVVYARSHRFSLDLRIILATVPVFFLRRGSY